MTSAPTGEYTNGRSSRAPPQAGNRRLSQPVAFPLPKESAFPEASLNLMAVAQVSGLSHPIDALLLSGDPYQKMQARIG